MFTRIVIEKGTAGKKINSKTPSLHLNREVVFHHKKSLEHVLFFTKKGQKGGTNFVTIGMQ